MLRPWTADQAQRTRTTRAAHVGARDANTPNPFGLVPRSGGLLDSLIDPPLLPSWLAPTDLDKFVQAFSISGFRGGLNYYYRNLDRNWEVQSALEGLLVEVPALYKLEAEPLADNVLSAQKGIENFSGKSGLRLSGLVRDHRVIGRRVGKRRI